MARRRADPNMSIPGMVAGHRLVLLAEDQNSDPLLILMNAAYDEEMHEHFKHQVPALRRRRAAAPVMARHRAKQELKLRQQLLRIKLNARERGL
jgi:hypothetical protein